MEEQVNKQTIDDGHKQVLAIVDRYPSITERLCIITGVLADTAIKDISDWLEAKYRIALCSKTALDAIDMAKLKFGDVGLQAIQGQKQNSPNE